MRGRGVALFFLGFAAGALTVALLLSWAGPQAVEVSAQSAYLEVPGPNRAPKPERVEPERIEQSHVKPGGIGLPLDGLSRGDIHDTFNEGRSGGRPHEATDIMAPRGTPVFAVVDGTIRKLFTSKQGGLTVYQFDSEEKYCYYYAHLDRYAAGLAENMAVKRGDLIGYAGSTGNAAPTAPHLHFAIFQLGPDKQWWGGKAIDPYPILIEALTK